MNKKSLAKLLLLIIIVMFLFPWVLVSCQGQKIMSATGFQLVTGHYDGSSTLSDYAGTNTSADTPNFWVILVLALSVLGIVITGDGTARVLTWLSSLQSLTLLGFLVGAPSSFYNQLAKGTNATTSSDLAAMKSAVRFEFQPGFYMTLVLALGCTFLCFAALREQNEEVQAPAAAELSNAWDESLGTFIEVQMPVAAEPSPRPSLSSRVNTSGLVFCPACGAQNPKGNTFCSNCGAKLQFCPACGAQNPKGNTFCSNCGAKLSKGD
ncbi:MAG: zinc ribbon domain-containing protein [Caldiserica bacterium]|nr:zinc ribbon domain-containing protein [Caldisericota bacterium]